MPVVPDTSPATESSEQNARTSKTPRGERKHEQLLHAAAKVLAARGYAGTTMTEIAEQAGTQAGSVYYTSHRAKSLSRRCCAAASR